MIKNPILYKVSWYLLDQLQSKRLNYLYVDTLAREQVLQQKVDHDRDYTLTYDYKCWILPCSQFDTVESLKAKSENPPYLSTHSQSTICNDDLCKITGIDYYGLVDQYQNHICVVDLDDFYT